MIKENIDELIKQAMLDKNHTRTEVLRAIKNEFLVYQTAKNAKPLDEAAEISILNKMVKQRTESRDQYILGNRQDLANKELSEISIISEFLPQKVTHEEMFEALLELITSRGWGDGIVGPQIPKKCMGEAIKTLKDQLKNVDGKELAELVKSYV